MHSTIFREFDRICRERGARGRVLEVGAVASPDTLMMLPSLRRADERVGINLDGPFEWDGCLVHGGNANDMAMFAEASFGTVVCNSVLEHDPFFWKTLSEMRRVLRPGGLLVLGVPAFDDLGMGRWSRLLRFLPISRRVIEGWRASTLTLHVHNYPSDCYSFSLEACRTVLMHGLERVEVHRLMVPPRVIGAGVKPTPEG
jgi:SAM-dependent methyltransferase